MSVPTRSRTRPAPAARGARRRTYLKADARRAQILDVAKDVFVKRGYRVANVADLCRAARIGRGTLYQYFDSKQAVLLAVMEEVCGRVEQVLAARPRIEAMGSPARVSTEEIVRFCEGRLRQLLQAVFVDEATLRLILRDARGLDGSVDRVIARIDAHALAALEHDLAAAQRLGFLRKGDVRLIARFILGGVEKMVLSALQEDAPVDLDLIVKTAVQLELYGLSRKEARR